MAFSSTNLFTTLGKFIKHINIWNGYLTALDTAKTDVSTVLNTYSLLDYFVPVPGQIDAFQAQVSGWIQQYIDDARAIILDEPTVISQLPIATGGLDDVLDAIFDYMVANTVSIKTSVVSIGGSDVDISKFRIPRVGTAGSGESWVFISRILDGINNPSNTARARDGYRDLESQLAVTCTEYAKCVSSNPGQEVVQLFSEVDANPSYDDDSEKPGSGPLLTNIESNNLVPSNFDFSAWSGDNPTDWSVTPGVAGTAWEDASGIGVGPLRINTAGTYAKQKIGNLTRRQQYYFGAVFSYTGSSGQATAKLRVENSDGSTVHKNFTNVDTSDVAGDPGFNFIYGYFTPSDSINLDDIYLVFEHDSETNGATSADLYRTVVSPVRFFNGLGHVFWNPITDITGITYGVGVNAGSVDPGYPPELPVDSYGSIAISNSNAGVIQTFFRRAFGIQMPTNDSPSLADSLAT